MKLLSSIYIALLCLSNAYASYDDTQCPDVVNTNKLSDRRTNPNKLTLMQYNVEWLFLDYYSAADCPGNGCTWHNESEAEEHLGYVYNVIDKINPDIINFCEIEGCDELNALINLLDTDEYNPYLIKGTDTATGQNVGMLTKIDPTISLYRVSDRETYPVEGSKCGYTGEPQTTSVSKHYVSEFFINDINIAIISAHLIAFPTVSTRCSQREAQAVILQNLINKYVKDGYEVIMMGDFNDFDEIVVDMNSNIPTSRTLDILKGLDGPLKDEYLLTSVASNIPQQERFSEWYDSDSKCNTKSKNDYSMIDHILVTNGLLKKIKNTQIYHGYREYCGKMNSDHYPVIVDFYF